MSKQRLPPGQHLTEKFPVLHAGRVPNITRDTWSLEIYGEVEHAVTFNYHEFTALKSTRIIADIHCVTTWSKFDTIWEGVRFKDLAELVRPTARARFVKFECEGGWTTSLPLSDLMDEDVLLAYRYDDRDLSIEHGGPVRGLVPKKYFYKSAKWIRKLKFMEKDELGFWERSGYSNTADPWLEDRYSR